MLVYKYPSSLVTCPIESIIMRHFTCKDGKIQTNKNCFCLQSYISMYNERIN